MSHFMGQKQVRVPLGGFDNQNFCRAAIGFVPRRDKKPETSLRPSFGGMARGRKARERRTGNVLDHRRDHTPSVDRGRFVKQTRNAHDYRRQKTTHLQTTTPLKQLETIVQPIRPAVNALPRRAALRLAIPGQRRYISRSTEHCVTHHAPGRSSTGA